MVADHKKLIRRIEHWAADLVIAISGLLLACLIALTFYALGRADRRVTTNAVPMQSRSLLPKSEANKLAVPAKAEDNNNEKAPVERTPANMEQWMPPILALFGSLMVVVVTAWLNTKALSSQIDALRAEMRQGFAEFRLEVRTDASDLHHRVQRLEEERNR